MHQTFLRRIISLIALLTLSSLLGTSALAQPSQPAQKGNFCVSTPMPRAAGVLPERRADCPPGYLNQGGSCKREAETRPAPSIAPDCPAGYKLNGASCERPAVSKPNPAVRAADCPTGYSNSGAFCFRLSEPDPIPASRMSCKAGETKIDTRCFKPCETGSANAGASCVRPVSTLGADKMSCKAGYKKDDKKARCVAQCPAGFNNTGEACQRPAESLGAESLSCKAGETRQGGRCVAVVATCAKGEVMQGGSCFAACAPGFDGVGGACWPQAPKAWVTCGIGAAKDAQSCAAARMDQVTMVKQHAVSLGRDGNVPAAPGQKVTRLVALHAKFRDLAAAYNSAKESAQFKRDLAAWTQANQGGDSFMPLDDTGAPITEPVMMQHAVQLAAIAGYAGANDSAGYPKCSTIR